MKTFRKSLMGFNKNDVVNYIDSLVKEKDGMIAERDRRLEKLGAELEAASGVKGELDQAAGQNDMLKANVDELLLQKARLERDLTKADGDKTALEARVAELEKALAESAAALEKANSDESQSRDELQELLAESIEENRSLKRHNLMLLERNNDLEEAVKEAARVKKAAPRVVIQRAEAPKAEEREDGQAVMRVFKSHLYEISKDLALLAQAIIDAESREEAPAPKYKAPEREYPRHEEYELELPDEEEPENAYVVVEERPADSADSTRRLSMKEILDRIKIIGDKLR